MERGCQGSCSGLVCVAGMRNGELRKGKEMDNFRIWVRKLVKYGYQYVEEARKRISAEVKTWSWFQVFGFWGAGRRSGRDIQKVAGAVRLDIRKQARA